MRLTTRYLVLLILILFVSLFLFPAIFRGPYPHPAGPTFDKQVSKLYLHEIEEQHPSLLLLGDSILTKGVEKELLEEKIGEPVYKLDIPGSASALWYLVLKSNIAPASPGPRSLVILFRDTLLTTPTFRTLPPYFGMIDKFAAPDDKLLLERAYLAQLTPLQIAFERYFPVYTYRAEIRESADSGLRHTLPAAIGCDRSCADEQMTNVLGDIQPDIFAESIIQAERGNYTDERLDFTGQVSQSFLPEIIRLARESNIQLILVRAPTNLFPDARREPASLAAYMAEMHDYLAGEGVPLIDLSHVEGIGPAQFADPHHLSVDGKAIFTRVLAENLKKYLNKFKPTGL